VAQQVRNHPDVLDACALVVEIEQGDERLVAYLACADPEAFDRPGLMRALRRSLPGYMVPQHTMLLEALPKTPNGKLDRNALPSPTPTAARFEAPATETENRLAELWGSVLKEPRVSRQDRFFDIGGHSLSAIQVSLELERALGVDVSPNLLVMENLAGVAAELDRLLAERSPAAAVAIEEKVSRDDAVGRHGMLARLWARLRQGAGG
jgi:acyl carrier protein